MLRTALRMAGKKRSSQGPLEAILARDMGEQILLEYELSLDGVRGAVTRALKRLGDVYMRFCTTSGVFRCFW